VGEGVFVGSNSWLQTVGEGDGEPALFLGDGTSISGLAHISAAQSIRLGRNVLLARNVFITDHGHRFDDLEVAVLSQGITPARPVVIGDGAWLGENVVVLPGVTVGTGAVVGANSVVVDDVPEHAIAVGAPARVLRVLASQNSFDEESAGTPPKPNSI
jgi:acetyltransferase-like isoleucine patch superfamily enzyme